MATTFDGVAFAVSVDSADLPAVEPAEDGAEVWAGTIRIEGNTNFENLRAKLVKNVIVRPALGSSFGGAIIIPGEGAFGDLTIPANLGAEQTWRAVLRSFRPISASTANIWRVDVEFVCGERVS